MHSFSNPVRSRFVTQTRSIQSVEKERADIFGHNGRDHLVLVCAVIVNKLCRRQPAQMGLVRLDKPDFSYMHRSRSDLIKNAECFTAIDLDRSRFEKDGVRFRSVI